jgi:hypothetical protein
MILFVLVGLIELNFSYMCNGRHRAAAGGYGSVADWGMPGCDTTCGDVRVPYPFGFGPGRCYLPGFDLTCDKGHNPPRLLLGGGNSTFQVFLNDSTMRVVHATTLDITTIFQKDSTFQQVGVRFPDNGGPYMLSARNEFVVTGCNVEATPHAATGDSIVSCVSNCTEQRWLLWEPLHH